MSVMEICGCCRSLPVPGVMRGLIGDFSEESDEPLLRRVRSVDGVIFVSTKNLKFPCEITILLTIFHQHPRSLLALAKRNDFVEFHRPSGCDPGLKGSL